MIRLAQLRHWIVTIAEDSRAPPIVFTCLAFLSVIIGAHIRSTPWIGATLAIDLCALLLWGRPTFRINAAELPADQKDSLQRALATCLTAMLTRLDVTSVVVDDDPFPEPAATVTRSRTAGTLYLRHDCLTRMSEAQIRAILSRELVHLTHRDDVRQWITTVMMLFLLVAGSAAVALLRICLGSRVGGVDMLGSVAACFVGVPTAVFLLQYVRHEIEYLADREVARRDPALATALIEWLQREEEQQPHPFVVIPHPIPLAVDRIEQLRRLEHPDTWRAAVRPLMAVAAAVILVSVAIAVTDLMDGKVPDVAMDSSPASAAREAIASAKSVRQAAADFAIPKPERIDAELRDASAQIDQLRARFERSRQKR